MRIMNLIVMLISAIISVSAVTPTKMKRSLSEVLGNRNGLYNTEYEEFRRRYLLVEFDSTERAVRYCLVNKYFLLPTAIIPPRILNVGGNTS
uniref:Uncharacterized protein n=1 Tax=Ostertagia ostertagi TaxID=6317 RepID=O61572_OSTOS|nr:hypothetical protein jmo23 [Ostertagia ostertagi]